MIKKERSSDHLRASRCHLRPAMKPSQSMPYVAVCPFNGECKIFSIKMPLLRQKSKEATPFVRYKWTGSCINAGDELLSAGIATMAQFPSKRSTRYPVNGTPDPYFVFFPFTKCQTSSIITISDEATELRGWISKAEDESTLKQLLYLPCKDEQFFPLIRHNKHREQ